MKNLITSFKQNFSGLDRKGFYSFLILSFICGTAFADTDIIREVSVESSSADGNSAIAEVSTPTGDLGLFTRDFSALGDEPLTVTWKAPAGKMIQVTRPTGYTGNFFIQFQIRTANGTEANGAFTDFGPGIAHTNLTGSPVAVGGTIRVSGNGPDGIEAAVTQNLANPGDTISFDSLTASTTVSASYNRNHNNAAFDTFRIHGVASAQGGDSLANPGQWIKIVDLVSPPLEIVRELSEPSFTSDANSATAFLATPNADLSEVTYDFSSAGPVPLSITWKAPQGKLIEVTRPAGFTSNFLLQFFIRTGIGTVANNAFQEFSPTVSYTGLQGNLPGAASRFLQLSGGIPEGIEGAINEDIPNPGERIRFSSLTTSTTVPAFYARTISNVALDSFYLRGVANKAGGDNPADPGQWIRLVDIPDPNAARKAKIRRQLKKLKRQINKARKKRDRKKLRRLLRKFRNLSRILRRL